MELTSTSVFLQKCPGYEHVQLNEIFGQVILSTAGDVNLRSLKVLLKPNLITAKMGLLACTEGKFIVAAAKWFLDHGANVWIGDSPAFGTAGSVLQKIGIGEELKKLPLTISNFAEVRKIHLSSGITAGIAVDALDCDFLINMPRVKAHAQMRVSLGVKNFFGCVVGMRKPWWHMTYGGCDGGFADHLVELLAVLPAGITLVDGITAMHETGPITGKPYPLGIVGCSSNPVAIDRSLLDILDIRPENSPIMTSCMNKNLVGSDFAQLEFPLRHPSELIAESFQIPEVLHPVRFNPFRFIKNNIRRFILKIHPAS